MGLIGGFAFPNMIRPSLEAGPKVNQISADGFKIRDYAKMYGRIPGYDLFTGCDLPDESELAGIANGI